MVHVPPFKLDNQHENLIVKLEEALKEALKQLGRADLLNEALKQLGLDDETIPPGA